MERERERERERCSFVLCISCHARSHASCIHNPSQPPLSLGRPSATRVHCQSIFSSICLSAQFYRVLHTIASHAFCLRIYVLRASYHFSSQLQSLSCTLRLIVPLTHQLFAKQCLVSSSLYSHQSYQSCYRANQTQTHRFLSYDFDFIFV